MKSDLWGYAREVGNGIVKFQSKPFKNMTYTNAKCYFKNKKAFVRFVDGKMDMITFFVPFGELPIGCKFRFGYQQDDYTFKKTNDITAVNRWDGFFNRIKVKKNKKVLIDFYLYRMNGRNLNNII